jgi:cytochrome P450
MEVSGHFTFTELRRSAACSPDRWLGGPPGNSAAIPGVWGETLTFISGPRSCIGYRFALLECAI